MPECWKAGLRPAASPCWAGSLCRCKSSEHLDATAFGVLTRELDLLGLLERQPAFAVEGFPQLPVAGAGGPADHRGRNAVAGFPTGTAPRQPVSPTDWPA